MHQAMAKARVGSPEAAAMGVKLGLEQSIKCTTKIG